MRSQAAVGVGVFSTSHIAVPALDEVLRLVRPGGRIVACIRIGHDDTKGFRRRFEALQDEGRLRIVARREAAYMRATDDRCEILVIEPR